MTAAPQSFQQMTEPLRQPSIVDRLNVLGKFLPEQKSIFSEAAARIQELETALQHISQIEDSYTGSDWQEIEEARQTSRAALSKGAA
jgi:hypothetical protein